MPEPLQGFTVVEMTLAVQGPAAGVYLRDMGAQVVKIEPPLGDPARYGRGRDNDSEPNAMGAQYVACNRGKRSLCVDVSTQQGKAVVWQLLQGADVFLTNYRLAALEQLGFGYDAVHEHNPSLVYASVNGFGPDGEDADKAMLDGAAVARGGMLSTTGEPGGDPCLPGAIIADTAGAMQLALGVMTALLARERHGTGQRVQVSGLGSQLWLQQWELTHTSMFNAQLSAAGNHHPNIRGPYGAYRTADGGAILIAQTMAEEAWDAFCAFGEVPELAIDPRLQTPGQRLGEGMTDQDSAEIRALMTQAFARHDTMVWDAFLRTQPEIIWERVRNLGEVLEDPQNLANGYITEVDVPVFGRKRVVGNLVTLSETPGSVKGGPPELGEGNQEVLSQLGVAQATIEQIEAHATQEREAAFAELLGAQMAEDQGATNS